MIPILLVIACSIGVFLDARRIGIRRGLVSGVGRLGPIGWSMLTLFLWIIGFPLYLAYRPKYLAALDKLARSGSQADGLVEIKPMSGFVKLLFFVGFIVVAVLLTILGSMSPASSTRTF